MVALLAVLAGALAVLAPSPAAAAEDDPPPLTITRYPDKFPWADAVIDLPWTGAVLKDGTVCPGGRIDFTPNPDYPSFGRATVGNFNYSIRLEESGGVTTANAREAIVQLSCQRSDNYIGTNFHYLYYFKWSGSKNSSKGAYYPVVRDFITSGDASSSSTHLVTFIDGRVGAIDVRHFLYQRGSWLRTFTWTADGFVANVPLPFYPEADTPPV
ncbi:hypothetical protein [Cryptosporangium minutisporangium]|uniref:Uncharacterized protein n=1 Tax=Cryptosporangium minutisporangium TaxID=113569 RepID=A0ABP6TAJ7_9ACTN